MKDSLIVAVLAGVAIIAVTVADVATGSIPDGLANIAAILAGAAAGAAIPARSDKG